MIEKIFIRLPYWHNSKENSHISIIYDQTPQET